MKATELRIGNIVIRQGKQITVSGADIKWFEDGSYIGFNPIPLTEEWLIRFGFEKKENDYYCSYNLPRISGEIKIETERWFVLIEHIIISRCESIHSLQNLYFALTGEELTTKTRQNEQRSNKNNG